MFSWLSFCTVIRLIGNSTAYLFTESFDNKFEPKLLISVTSGYSTNYNLVKKKTEARIRSGAMSQPTGYEPKAHAIPKGQAMLSDARVGGVIDSNVSDAAVPIPVRTNGESDQMVMDTGRPTYSSSSIATTRSVAGGDSVAANRRLVDVVRSSPTKDDLYQELTEINAKLLNSEGETQRVKAVMSAKCNATISSYVQQFRVAAGQFQILSQ